MDMRANASMRVCKFIEFISITMKYSCSLHCHFFFIYHCALCVIASCRRNKDTNQMVKMHADRGNGKKTAWELDIRQYTEEAGTKTVRLSINRVYLCTFCIKFIINRASILLIRGQVGAGLCTLIEFNVHCARAREWGNYSLDFVFS